ncbi:MAG TPA: hypothetical protein PLN06_00095 [Bacteroidales bacterium]|nr:hypothetical protein [Bacteroidales bacterium]HCI54759.1 hypothetical protein [Bacteroidales bacterium]HOU95011.1 hypothetical protein [Bacteroidales bacterium]HQG35712.1 hypothetical protein [Bacteroidales bacterium]HQG53359.1 hypothetical protein [Bacteroidales bacterium]
MKTKIYIGLLGVLLIPGFSVNAQQANINNYRDDSDNTKIVINNYYDYDFYYSSRIRRFHSPYVSFSYYSPVFTDVFWYTYQPFTWGLSIYGGGRIGVGISFNFPIYYNYYWDWPLYYGVYYSNYYPVYYSWYSPIVFNVRIYNRWTEPWNGYHVRNRWYNNYRPVYNTYNYYYYNSSVRGDGINISRRTTQPTTSTVNSVNRQEGDVVRTSGRTMETPATSRRTDIPSDKRIHQGDQGNNNSLNPGNTENVNRRVNSGNNPGVVNRSNNGNGNGNNVNRGNSSNNGNINNDNNRRQVDQVKSHGQGNAVGVIPGQPQAGNRYNSASNAQQNSINMPGSTRPSSSSRNISTQSSVNRTNVTPQTRQSSTSRNVVRQSSRQSGNTSSSVRSAPAQSKSSSSASSENKSSSGKNKSSESSSSRRK